MKQIIAIGITFMLAGCGPCPKDCSAPEVAKCDNQEKIFRANLLASLAPLQTKFESYEAARGFLDASAASIVAEVQEQYQPEWDQQQVMLLESLGPDDLGRVCRFHASSTVSHGELLELGRIANASKLRGEVMTKGIIENAVVDIEAQLIN